MGLWLYPEFRAGSGRPSDHGAPAQGQLLLVRRRGEDQYRAMTIGARAGEGTKFAVQRARGKSWETLFLDADPARGQALFRQAVRAEGRSFIPEPISSDRWWRMENR